MARLRYFTRNTVEELRRKIAERLDWYYAPDGRECPWQFPSGAWRESQIESQGLSEHLNADGDKPSDTDATNALLVFRNLRDLTPQQAADERLWVYLSHFDCADYVAKRWLGSRPENADEATSKARNHFFARDTRAVIRDHGVSRLWWLGFIAQSVHSPDPGLFLEVVLYRQDVTWELFGRPSVSINRQVLRGIFAVMQDHWVSDRLLFKREVFRAWMVNLNRRGGVALLDVLPEDLLMRLLRDESERALKAEGA